MTYTLQCESGSRAMPKGTKPLFFIQIVSTLSFSVLFCTLVLYMKGPLHLKATTANSIMGVFVAFNYGLHLLGGYWGGRLFSNRGLFCIGMAAQIVGCLLLSFVSETFLYYGLAAFLTGSGLNVTCVNCMLTQRFSPKDARRETAFLWNYAGMNIGFFIGYTMSGYFQLLQNYERLFLLSSIGNLVALLICLYHWHTLADRDTTYANKTQKAQRTSFLFGLSLVILLPMLLHHLLHHSEMANKLVLMTGFFMLMLISLLAFQQKSREDRNKMLAFAVLMIAGTVFWMLFMLAPMGMTNFIEHNVHRNIAGFTIPPQWFQNVNTISIVLGGPVLALLMNKMRHRGVNVNIPAQFASALFLIGLAFLILPVAIQKADAFGFISPSWIVLCYGLQSFGELLISPIGYAMIGLLAPASLQGVMMGMWMLTGGVGATLASYHSNWMTQGIESVSPLVTNSGYSFVFLVLGLTAMSASVILYLLTPQLKRLMKTVENEKIADSELVTA